MKLAIGVCLVMGSGLIGKARVLRPAFPNAGEPGLRQSGDRGERASSVTDLDEDTVVSTFYPASARANAQANARRYDWARRKVEEAIRRAEPWVNTSDEALWRMIIPPKLKRAIGVNVNRGCPNCGMAMYGDRGPRPYAWIAWVEGHPWKVQCPNCKELFPKNDFGSFYETGIDPQTGLFDPQRADRTLLFNAEHPDPADPQHTYAVDDGSGWQRFPGGLSERDWYIAYHTYFGRNGRVTAAIRNLAYAYAVTGRPIYAHKGAILLDRLADVHPDYDGENEQFFNNIWKRYSAGIVGPNYWDGGSWAQRALDYDMIREGIGLMPETLAFLGQKARQHATPLPKRTVADIHRNIRERILVETGRHPDRIDMNGSITEMCRLKVELVLQGRTSLTNVVARLLPSIVPPQHLNPDGSGNERSTGYDGSAFGQYCDLLEDLAGLDREVAAAALASYPNLRAAFDFWPDIWCLEKFLPQIGDTGEPGAASGPMGTAGAYLTLFQLTGQARYARIARQIAGGDSSSMPRNIFASDPENLARQAMQTDPNAAPWRVSSVVKRDYQLGILRSGSGIEAQAWWLFYSPKSGTSSHSHFDALTVGLYAFGVPLIVEQGYPLYTGNWPARWAWTSHTRSHATVMVDGQCQRHGEGGALLGFGETNGVRFLSAEAPSAYANLSRYRRTIVAIELGTDRFCYADVFRVKGGRDHFYNLPLFYGTLRIQGLSLSPQEDLHESFVTRVQGGSAQSRWYAEADLLAGFQEPVAAHLRVHGPAGPMTVFAGSGETRWGKEDPRRLPHLILRRQSPPGELETCFALLYEPYRAEPFLEPGSVVIQSEQDRVRFKAQLQDGTGSLDVSFRDAGPSAVLVEGARELSGQAQTFRLAGISPTARQAPSGTYSER